LTAREKDFMITYKLQRVLVWNKNKPLGSQSLCGFFIFDPPLALMPYQCPKERR
jgi:hypothetical protein